MAQPKVAVQAYISVEEYAKVKELKEKGYTIKEIFLAGLNNFFLDKE